MTETMVKFLNAHGGVHTLEDFRDFQPEWVEPVSTTYRGWTVYELPPNGQGIAALSMLSIMEHFPLAQYGHNSVDALHIMIEAKKLAYSDMYKYVGDPRFTTVPVKQLISKELADKRAKLIDMNKAACQVVPSEVEGRVRQARQLNHLSFHHRQRRQHRLAYPEQLCGLWYRLCRSGLGFSFQNRGAGFQLTPGLPNSLAGHKRPLHTIIPAFMEKGDLHIGFGIMGGWNQGAGPRAVRIQYRRFRHERAGRA